MGNKGAHCYYGNMTQISPGPSKRRRIQAMATDQPTLSAMFSSSESNGTP